MFFKIIIHYISLFNAAKVDCNSNDNAAKLINFDHTLNEININNKPRDIQHYKEITQQSSTIIEDNSKRNSNKSCDEEQNDLQFSHLQNISDKILMQVQNDVNDCITASKLKDEKIEPFSKTSTQNTVGHHYIIKDNKVTAMNPLKQKNIKKSKKSLTIINKNRRLIQFPYGCKNIRMLKRKSKKPKYEQLKKTRFSPNAKTDCYDNNNNSSPNRKFKHDKIKNHPITEPLNKKYTSDFDENKNHYKYSISFQNLEKVNSNNNDKFAYKNEDIVTTNDLNRNLNGKSIENELKDVINTNIADTSIDYDIQQEKKTSAKTKNKKNIYLKNQDDPFLSDVNSNFLVRKCELALRTKLKLHNFFKLNHRMHCTYIYYKMREVDDININLPFDEI